MTNIVHEGKNYRRASTISPNYDRNLEPRSARRAFISESDNQQRRNVLVIGNQHSGRAFPNKEGEIVKQISTRIDSFVSWEIISVIEKRKASLTGEGTKTAKFLAEPLCKAAPQRSACVSRRNPNRSSSAARRRGDTASAARGEIA